MRSRHIILLTGLSGSGKTTAARALEDAGCFVVDNLPLSLLSGFVQQLNSAEEDGPLGVVTDVRGRRYLEELPTLLESLENQGYQVSIFFFDASDQVLIQRYSETRRRHPLGQSTGVPEAIAQERQIMEPLRQRATLILDTSYLTVHQLRRQVLASLYEGTGRLAPMVVRLLSFAFSRGLPQEADLVFDVRFLPNPHYQQELRALTGKDMGVQHFLQQQSEYNAFWDHLSALLQFLLPAYRQEGKSYLTVAVGCTGGRHRSVAVVEALRALTQADSLYTEVFHRDLTE